MHSECSNASHGINERFPRMADISDEAVPGDPTIEKGSINVNSLTYYPYIMHRTVEFGTELSPLDVRAPRSILSDDRTCLTRRTETGLLPFTPSSIQR
jgi:hypothetical protein